MSRFLLQEYEIMQNPAIGANALWAFTQGFKSRPTEELEPLTLWHLITVLPLVFHDTGRKTILKKRKSSGLRSILERDNSVSLARNETIFNINNRIQSLENRSLNSLNVAIACNLISIEEGYFISNAPYSLPKQVSEETKDILNAANKLGEWAGGMPVFEYLTILGVEPLR